MRKEMNIRYEELTRENLEVIKDLQRRIFPESSFEQGYELLLEKGPGHIGNEMQTYFIAYVDDEPAGTYGLYIPNGVEEHHSIWLGWYGILPTFRGKGVGKRILLDSMEKAKEYQEKYPVKYYRLYTSEAVNDTAQPLYNKVMDLKEYYRHEELVNDAFVEKLCEANPDKSKEECADMLSHMVAIFSKSLDEKEILVPWDSYYMSFMKTVAVEKDYTKAE